MRRGHDRDLRFGVQVDGLDAGEVVEGSVHDRDVRRAVEQEPRLLADLAQLDVDRDRVGDTGIHGGLVRVEQGLQERV